ncbi:MAG: hypothetical protein V9H69_21000 [Anaerolineae bacterium]
MNGRERIALAMRHRLPDRVPVMCQLAIGHYFLNTSAEAARDLVHQRGLCRGAGAVAAALSLRRHSDQPARPAGRSAGSGAVDGRDRRWGTADLAQRRCDPRALG